MVIVTDANCGIGFEAAKEFVRKGARTILACRSMDKAQAALNQIQAEIPNAPAEIMQIDMASQASIHRYFGPRRFMEQRGYPVAVESNDASHDEQDARQLWHVSEQLAGVRYTQLDKVSMS